MQNEPEEITPDWVKENLWMEGGNDITECYSDETIDHISWLLCAWEDFDYKDAKEVLNQFHLTIKNKLVTKNLKTLLHSQSWQ